MDNRQATNLTRLETNKINALVIIASNCLVHAIMGCLMEVFISFFFFFLVWKSYPQRIQVKSRVFHE